MVKKSSSNLLECMGRVYEMANRSRLEPEFFNNVELELKQISAYLGTTRMQSLLVAMVFALNYKEHAIGLKNLIDFFQCNPVQLLKHSGDFEVLCSRGILFRKRGSRRKGVSIMNDEFLINDALMDAILNRRPMPNLETEEFKDVIAVLEKFHELGEKRDEEEISSAELLVTTQELLDANRKFPLLNNILEYNLFMAEAFLYLSLIWNTLSGSESSDMSEITERIFDSSWHRVRFVQKIISSDCDLIRHDLIEVEEANFFNDVQLRLTSKSVQMLREFGLHLFANKKKCDGLIMPERINVKRLFFNRLEEEQLDLLRQLLHEDRYAETQVRLKEKGLPKGITALLHGVPGTGKTETVYQIAKATDREIVKVEISQSKSMWFGESEKKIKRIFTDYKLFAKECRRMPILMFNEADAIISKRRESSASGVSQTENAIQNILLEELENFEGIFFATTNLAGNLDDAFERRFLFKIEFKKPELEVKAKIWNSKLSGFSEEEYLSLAEQFDFSGGQIENIIRKNEMHEIIHGKQVSFKNIVDFCQAEFLNKNPESKIGFK
jgi:hypothetical protein